MRVGMSKPVSMEKPGRVEQGGTWLGRAGGRDAGGMGGGRLYI